MSGYVSVTDRWASDLPPSVLLSLPLLSLSLSPTLSFLTTSDSSLQKGSYITGSGGKLPARTQNEFRLQRAGASLANYFRVSVCFQIAVGGGLENADSQAPLWGVLREAWGKT